MSKLHIIIIVSLIFACHVENVASQPASTDPAVSHRQDSLNDVIARKVSECTSAMRQGDYRAAIDKATAFLEYMEDSGLGSRAEYYRMLATRGFVFSELKKVENARMDFEISTAHIEALDDGTLCLVVAGARKIGNWKTVDVISESSSKRKSYPLWNSIFSAYSQNRRFYPKALSAFTILEKIVLEQFGHSSAEYAKIIAERGILYANNGRNKDAQDDFKTAGERMLELPYVVLCEMTLNAAMINDTKTLEKVAQNLQHIHDPEGGFIGTMVFYYYVNTQRLGDAMDVASVLEPILLSYHGKDSQQYADFLELKGEMYGTMMMKPEAASSYRESLDINRKLGNSGKVAAIEKILGKGDVPENPAEYGEERSMEIAKAISVVCAVLGIDDHNKEELVPRFREYLVNARDNLGKDNNGAASVAYFCDLVSALMYNKSEIVEIADLSFEFIREYFPKYSPMYLKYANRRLQFRLQYGDHIEASLLDDFLEAYKAQSVTLSSMTENERKSFWSSCEDYATTFENACLAETPSPSRLYDFSLFNKGLLLNMSTSFSRRILSSGDPDLVEKYRRLREMQGVARAQDAEKGLEKNIERLERELAAGWKIFADYFDGMTGDWKSVQNSMDGHDVAVEYINYMDVKTSEDRYVALVLRPGWPSPELIPLCEAGQLPRLSDLGDGKAYKDYPSQQYYKFLFQPLEKYLHPGEKVFFSPSGIVHMLAIESLTDDDGMRLGDKYDMRRVSSTRNVRMKDVPSKYASAVVYGGLEYDVSPDVMHALSRSYSSMDDGRNIHFVADATRSGWEYLSGTKDEADMISSSMASRGISVEKYEGKDGNEESFKSLSGKGMQIIHMATHGFFLPALMIDDDSEFKGITEDPMTRSGLMLSGGNYSWTGNGSIDNVEDGVLLAYEIANLDLSKVDLAVLSACETALGDVTDEGVFGLQRGFKNAGVGTIVMSLWRVDDNATSLMMGEFYANLLSGMTKVEAFRKAQKTLRDKYRNPYYWAAFIMLD